MITSDRAQQDGPSRAQEEARAAVAKGEEPVFEVTEHGLLSREQLSTSMAKALLPPSVRTSIRVGVVLQSTQQVVPSPPGWPAPG